MACDEQLPYVEAAELATCAPTEECLPETGLGDAIACHPHAFMVERPRDDRLIIEE